jgi:hypothetical protein
MLAAIRQIGVVEIDPVIVLGYFYESPDGADPSETRYPLHRPPEYIRTYFCDREARPAFTPGGVECLE